MNTGLFGFSERIPNVDRIKSVSVTIVGETTGYGLFGEGDRWYSDNNFQYIPATNVLTGELTSSEDIKSAINAHKLIANTDVDEATLSNNIQFIYTNKHKFYMFVVVLNFILKKKIVILSLQLLMIWDFHPMY